jgi:hypothetical protein
MRKNRGIVRGVSLLLSGVIALTALAGCARANEDLVEEFEKDAAVAAAVLVEGSGPRHYEITLDDDVAPGELAEVTTRLKKVADTALDDRWTFSARTGVWEWRLDGDEETAVARAEGVAAMSGIEGVYSGSVGTSEDGTHVSIVADAGVSPTSFAQPVTDAAKAAALPQPLIVKLSDLHDRSTIAGDLDQLRGQIDGVDAAAAVGEIQSFTVEANRFSIRMRTAEGAAAAAPVIEDALVAGGGGPGVRLRSGITSVGAGGDEQAAAAITALLAPIDGVVSAEVVQRSARIALLDVTTVDVETARAVEQLLTADPAVMAPYRSLQFTIPDPESPATIRALSTVDSGYVGSLAAASELAAADGVLSVTFTPSTLDVVTASDADAGAIATAVKAVALREQEAQIFGSTAWGPNEDRAAFGFTVLGKLNVNLVDGYGDKEAFVEAWNDAPDL